MAPAFIVVDESIRSDAYVKEMSITGARLICDNACNIPDEIEIHIPSENIRARAFVRWRTGQAFGIEFVEPVQLNDKRASKLDQIRS